MSAIPVGFYAPLKSHDHPVPSGDRTMARLFLAALGAGGFAPDVASRLRTFEPQGDPTRQRDIARASEAEADRLAHRYRALPAVERPRLWFTYHSYYKAPDHLGPLVSERLGIPYAAAEMSRAGKRRNGPWSFAHEAAEFAADRAAVIFALTRHDREALARLRPDGQRVVDLPPFLDAAPLAAVAARAQAAETGLARLLAVGMMRDGDKLASYRLLATGLDAIAALSWNLTIVGDGPARPEVERLFAPLGARVRFAGLATGPDIAGHYREADCLVWPAVNEAYGMVLLEAQASSCPVVAGAFGGVPDAMRPGETGLMPPPGDAAAFADAVAALIRDPARRRRMGRAAHDFISRERGVDAAAGILRNALLPLLRQSGTP